MMRFHHLGLATNAIRSSSDWIHSHFDIVSCSPVIFDPLQNVELQLIDTGELQFELVSGLGVESLVKRNISYYHICYEVDDIELSLKCFKESTVISPPTPAKLFSDRLVAFIMTPIGLVELLEG